MPKDRTVRQLAMIWRTEKIPKRKQKGCYNEEMPPKNPSQERKYEELLANRMKMSIKNNNAVSSQ
jgi:hypothetical protein